MTTLLGPIPFAHTLLTQTVKQGDTVIDATAGNGHDTLFLAKIVGDTGHVIGTDIQPAAIARTTERLKTAGVNDRVSLYCQGHETLEEISAFRNSVIAGAIFNLGYLPRGDKSITTTGSATVHALHTILSQLKQHGLVVLVIYSGHETGKKERDTVLNNVTALSQTDFHVLQYAFINQQNDPPFVIAIEKR
ncbi:class I SAM-dependent methyltransferase [Bacillus sp. FSL W7-1360]